MDKGYYPEGCLLQDSRNREYIKDLASLKYAMENEIILEGVAVMCDSYHNLHVELGQYIGIIPRQEVVFCPDGEQPKDIAIITRVGKGVSFVVTSIEYQEKGVKILLSRRLAQKKCFDNYINSLRCGDVIDVVVTHLEKFGVFCDVGCGIAALLPVDCISVSRISHPAERFSIGKTIKCVVKNVDKELCRVTLSHKELLGTWQENADMFEPGETACGIVRSVEDYGIFVELTPNLAGLAEWCDGVEEGDVAAVYIKSIIPEKMKIKLVIVGVSDEKMSFATRECFFDTDHVDVWQYSPEGCAKQVFTEFRL